MAIKSESGHVQPFASLLELLNPSVLTSNIADTLTPYTAEECGPSWRSILTPYLSALLASTCFNKTEVENHVRFFQDYPASWLSPSAMAFVTASAQTTTPNGYAPTYPSAMTNDHTPMELSCCWKSKSQSGIPIPRYVLEAVALDGQSRESSLKHGFEVIKALETVATNDLYGFGLSLFPGLWRRIIETLLDNNERIHNRQCSKCGPASTFVGFDIEPSRVRSKLYWLLPSCLSNVDLSSLLDTIFRDASAVDAFFLGPSFASAWSMIRAHLSTSSATLRPRMLSVDATQYPTPRIKLYTRCLLGGSLSFETLQPHLNLHGKLVLNPDFERTCRALWTALVQSIPESAPNPKYVLVLYEFSGARVSSKLYIMCQELPLSDAVVASTLLEHCVTVKGATFLQRIASQEKPTAYINEIGLAPRDDETEVAIYLNPCLFSQAHWSAESRGGMEKKRIAKPES